MVFEGAELRTAAFMEQYERPEEPHTDAQMLRMGLDRMSSPFKTVHQCAGSSLRPLGTARYIMRNQAGLGGVGGLEA